MLAPRAQFEASAGKEASDPKQHSSLPGKVGRSRRSGSKSQRALSTAVAAGAGHERSDSGENSARSQLEKAMAPPWAGDQLRAAAVVDKAARSYSVLSSAELELEAQLLEAQASLAAQISHSAHDSTTGDVVVAPQAVVLMWKLRHRWQRSGWNLIRRPISQLRRRTQRRRS